VTVFVDAVGNRRCAAAPDGAAAGGIADDHALAEQLGEQLGIRRLAAAGTGARELKQRLIELAALDRLAIDQFFPHRQGLGVFEIGHLGVDLGGQGLHHQGLFLGRADVRTVAAAHAVFGVHLHAELVVLELLADGFLGLEAPPAPWPSLRR
jgi:hypothetical protein